MVFWCFQGYKIKKLARNGITVANNFISSIDNDEERIIHSKRDNIEIVIDDEADEVIEELLKSSKNTYQNN